MVVDDIEDDFNSVGVQSGIQFSEFFNRRLRLRGLTKVRTKKTEGHITPVVVFLWIKLVHRHQLDNGPPEINKVRALPDNSAESPSPSRGHATAETRAKPPHMHP